nr:hypothetical protein [Tanacetum cinerariifolium]
MGSNDKNVGFSANIKNIDGQIGKDGKIRMSLCNVPMSEPGTFVMSFGAVAGLNKEATLKAECDETSYASMEPGNVVNIDNEIGNTTNVHTSIIDEDKNGSKQSIVEMFKKPSPFKVVRLTTMTSEHVQGANVATPFVVVEEGRNTYAWALIEVLALTPLMESVVVVVSYPDESGHSLKTVDVEYEWHPLDDDDGFMKVTRKNGKGKQDGKAKKVVGIRLTKPKPNLVYKDVHKPQNNNDNEVSSSKHDELMDSYDQLISIHNSFEKLMESDKLLDVADLTQATPTCTKNTSIDPLDNDEEEIEDVHIEPDHNISKHPKTNGNKGGKHSL